MMMGLHDQFDRKAFTQDEEFIGAGLDGGDGGDLRQLPAGAVGVYAGDGIDAFKRIVAVGTGDGSDSATAIRTGHGKEWDCGLFTLRVPHPIPTKRD